MPYSHELKVLLPASMIAAAVDELPCPVMCDGTPDAARMQDVENVRMIRMMRNEPSRKGVGWAFISS